MHTECYAYTRVSTVKQGNGVSLEAQREAIIAYAQKHNLFISRWFEEKETAAKQGRVLFSEMIKALNKRKAQGLIMHKIDRSARNLKDWSTVSDLQDLGIDVHFAAESVDFASRGGRLTADIQAVIAADYIRNLREETLKGLNGRLKQGLYPFKAPTGYLDTGGGNPKTICPDKGPKVKLLLECYASGEHSINSLVKEAHRIGLKSSRGGKVNKSAIEYILKNPFYIGLIFIKSRNETFDGIHKPLITPRLFKQITTIRESKAGKKVTKHDRTYRRMFTCGFCRIGYIGEVQKGLIYYRCHTKGCTKGGIREEALNSAVNAQLLGFKFSKLQEARLRQTIQRWGDDILKTESSHSNEMQLGKLKNKQDQLLDAFLDKLIDKKTFEDRKEQFLIQEKELSNLKQKQLSKDEIGTHIEQMFELLKNLYLTYSLANSREKRQILQIFFSNRTITGKNVELEPKDWHRQPINMLGVQFGPHSQDKYRRSKKFLNSVYETLNELFTCPEWKETAQLHDEIHKRASKEDILKAEEETSYR